ncbi:hypothetical protein AB4Z48_27240 [Cupriavidus sp. 2TAF22]|uniref:hypothetical protein n=1 Tax=unclassified Cupriavidus TaxID=2640874 RepID=UPI003F9053CB
MQLLLRAHTSVRTTIRNLAFPSTAIISADAGTIRCSHGARSRLLRPTQRLTLRPFTPIAIELGHEGAACIDVAMDALAHPGPGSSASRPLTRWLASLVLTEPLEDWNLDWFAGIAGISKASLSRRLFAEGSSFREAVRAHRLLRLLLDLPGLGRPSHAMVTRYGFSDRCQLEDAVFEQFGLTLRQLERLVAHETGSPAAVKTLPPDFGGMRPPAVALQCEEPPDLAPAPCQR